MSFQNSGKNLRNGNGASGSSARSGDGSGRKKSNSDSGSGSRKESSKSRGNAFVYVYPSFDSQVNLFLGSQIM